MELKEFINFSKKIIKDYYNTKKEKCNKIELELVDTSFVIHNRKAFFVEKNHSNTLYEVVFKRDTNEFYLGIYSVKDVASFKLNIPEEETNEGSK